MSDARGAQRGGRPDPSDFLYPMIDEGEPVDPQELLADLARSAKAKAGESARLSAATVRDRGEQLDRIAGEMADRFLRGGRLFTFGNGGSATDAAGIAALFSNPPSADVEALPARSLVADESVLTALANDIGFDAVFARQLIAHARPGDMAMGFSTSGNSGNVIAAFERAARERVLTVGFAGYDGGAMAACDALDHCVIVRSDSVHRIQEAQSAAAHVLWRRVHQRLGREVRV